MRTLLATALVLTCSCADDSPGFTAPDGYPGQFTAAWSCAPNSCQPPAMYGRATEVTIDDDATIAWAFGPTHQGEPDPGCLRVAAGVDGPYERPEFELCLAPDRLTGSTMILWWIDRTRSAFCLCNIVLTRTGSGAH